MEQQLTVQNRRLKSKKKRICSKVSVNSPGNSCSQSVPKKKRKARLEGFAEKESFKPGVKEWRGDGLMDDESGESMELMKQQNYTCSMQFHASVTWKAF